MRLWGAISTATSTESIRFELQHGRSGRPPPFAPCFIVLCLFSFDEAQRCTKHLANIAAAMISCTLNRRSCKLHVMKPISGTSNSTSMRSLEREAISFVSMSSNENTEHVRNSSSRGTRHSNASSLTLSACKNLFHLPVEVAARELGVSRPTIARVMRANGYRRWPYRRVKAASRARERAATAGRKVTRNDVQENDQFESHGARTVTTVSSALESISDSMQADDRLHRLESATAMQTEAIDESLTDFAFGRRNLYPYTTARHLDDGDALPSGSNMHLDALKTIGDRDDASHAETMPLHEKGTATHIQEGTTLSDTYMHHDPEYFMERASGRTVFGFPFWTRSSSNGKGDVNGWYELRYANQPVPNNDIDEYLTSCSGDVAVRRNQAAQAPTIDSHELLSHMLDDDRQIPVRIEDIVAQEADLCKDNHSNAVENAMSNTLCCSENEVEVDGNAHEGVDNKDRN